MATLQITEFSDFGILHDSPGYIPAPIAAEPAITTQNVTFTTATQSAAFNASTRLVRLLADADCHVKFGASPTATANDEEFKANTPEWRGVVAGQKVSVYDGTS